MFESGTPTATPGPPGTPPAANAPQSSSGVHLGLGAIIGIIVGSIFGASAALLALVAWRSRRRARLYEGAESGGVR